MSALTQWQECSANESYITCRVLDACIRENVRDITSRGDIISAAAEPELLTFWPLQAPASWLKISHLAGLEIWLAVEPCDFMQNWRVAHGAWLCAQDGQITCYNHYRPWLAQLSGDLPEAEASYYIHYQQECDCAVTHRSFAQDIFAKHREALGRSLFSSDNGFTQMCFADQLASHLDHPFYPTARAKFGLDKQNLADFCPEAMKAFELNWLAVPKTLCSNSLSQLPHIWPGFVDVGLPASLAQSHQLLPVHPLTLSAYLPNTLASWPHKDDIVLAPKSYLSVTPTLSVRTMALSAHPHLHIKLPLPMHTLGSKNIRTIKPSTLIDGHVFQQVLQSIARHDPQLDSRYIHCHEQQGGCVDKRSDLAWLLREYPSQVAEGTPVCIAAFLAENAHGELVIEQLARRYYGSDLSALMQDHMELQLAVHLRLWLKYGISLEANQQNALLLFADKSRPRLVLRDNDSGRILSGRLRAALPQANELLSRFIDQRMFADDELALLQMFTTITLQLNISALIETLHQRQLIDKQAAYQQLNTAFHKQLAALAAEGININYAQQSLLYAPNHYAKYLLLAGSLLSKEKSGAASINKFYGLSAPNPLLRGEHD